MKVDLQRMRQVRICQYIGQSSTVLREDVRVICTCKLTKDGIPCCQNQGTKDICELGIINTLHCQNLSTTVYVFLDPFTL